MYLLNHLFTPYSGHLLKMHVFYQKYCSYLCFSSIYGSPLFSPPHLGGKQSNTPCDKQFLECVRAFKKWLTLPAIVQTPGVCCQVILWKEETTVKRVSHLAFWLALKIWRVWRAGAGILMGGEDSCGGRRPLFPVGRRRRAGEAARDLVARTQKEQRTGAAIGGHWTAFPSAGRAPSSAPRERVRCVPGSVSISALRGVLENRLHHPLLLVGGCPALHAFCGLTCLLLTPPVLCLSPSASPQAGLLAPCSPRSPGLAAPLPFLPPARVHLFTSQAPSGTKAWAPFI